MHAHTQTRVTTRACRSKRVCTPLCEHRCMCEHVYTRVYTYAHSSAPSFTVVLWYSKMKNSNPVQLSPKSMWRIYHSFLSRKLLLRGYVINMLRGGEGDTLENWKNQREEAIWDYDSLSNNFQAQFPCWPILCSQPEAVLRVNIWRNNHIPKQIGKAFLASSPQGLRRGIVQELGGDSPTGIWYNPVSPSKVC